LVGGDEDGQVAIIRRMVAEYVMDMLVMKGVRT
jgi:hypothetical protein